MIFSQEVETKYNELRQTHSNTATDSDDNNGELHFTLSLGDVVPPIHPRGSLSYIYRASQTFCLYLFFFQMGFSDDGLFSLPDA